MGLGFTDQLRVTRSTAALSATDIVDAALQVEGGVAVKKNVAIGTDLSVAGAATLPNVTIATSLNLTATTVSSSKTTGALVLEGGLGVAKDLYATNIYGDSFLATGFVVTDELTVSGETRITNNLVVEGTQFRTSAPVTISTSISAANLFAPVILHTGTSGFALPGYSAVNSILTGIYSTYTELTWSLTYYCDDSHTITSSGEYMNNVEDGTFTCSAGTYTLVINVEQGPAPVVTSGFLRYYIG